VSSKPAETKDPDSFLTCYFSGSSSVVTLSSPGEIYELHYVQASEQNDPSTYFIKFVVVRRNSGDIVYQDRIRGTDIAWENDAVISVLQPFGILDKQDVNTKRYFIDVEKGQQSSGTSQKH
jgi:hypothetical protein